MSLPVLLLVQVYRPNEQFPEGGVMSQLLDTLQIGDTIDVKGPIGEIVYQEPGQLMIKDTPRTASHLAMLAGGTGITPMYQLLKAVLSNPDDKTMCTLIFANKKPSEILLREEVSSLDGGSDHMIDFGATFRMSMSQGLDPVRRRRRRRSKIIGLAAKRFQIPSQSKSSRVCRDLGDEMR